MLRFSEKAIDIPKDKRIAVLRINSGNDSPYIKKQNQNIAWDYNAKSVADNAQDGIYGMRVDYLSLGFDFHVRVIFASMPVDMYPKILLLEVNRDDVIDGSKITEISFRRANIIKIFNLSDFRIFSVFYPRLNYIPRLFYDCASLRIMYQEEDYTNWVECMKKMLDAMFERLSQSLPKTYIEKVRKKYDESTKYADVQIRLTKMLQEIVRHHNKLSLV